MRTFRRLFLLLFLVAPLATRAGDKMHIERPVEYHGMCDASGGVAVSSNLFIAVNDEDNILRLYRSDQPGMPIKQFDCNAFLELTGKSDEADLEGAARIGDRAYWIGSHGRNKDGKFRPNRDRFFATDIKVVNGDVTLKPVGTPCKTLLDQLVIDPQFTMYHFENAARLAPKAEDALNIEGLSATPQGQLLIGFRNPVPQGKALLIPMLNPDEVIAGKFIRFGPAIQLDLDGLGIRDIALYQDTYLIIAGSWHGGGPFELYRWKGPGTELKAIKVKHLGRYQPEGIIIYPDKGLREVQILSDDGTRLIDGMPGKLLPDISRRAFRSFWVVE